MRQTGCALMIMSDGKCGGEILTFTGVSNEMKSSRVEITAAEAMAKM